MGRSLQTNVLVVAILVVAGGLCARAAEPQPIALPPVIFEGLGLGDFRGSGSIAGALRQAIPDKEPSSLPLDVVVRGPSGRVVSTEQLAAEIRSRIEALDLSAGVVATPGSIHDGLSTLIGGMRLHTDHEAGREVLELRTSLTQNSERGVFGIEVGPRIERRLRRGAVLFFDGKAEATALRSAETGEWSLPGSSVDGMVGVAARTGLKR